MLACMAYGAVTCLMLPRILKGSADDLIDISWVFAMALILPAFTATINGLVEMWVYYTSVLVSICLLVITMWIAIVARRALS